MNKLRFVTLIEIRTRLAPLIDAHWQEVVHFKHVAPPEPMWAMYAHLEAVGRLILVAVEREGVLIGYASYILGPMQHHGSIVAANCDAIYIRPEHRHGRLAQRILNFCETEAARRGARVILSTVSINNDFGPLLDFLGYKNIELTYAKTLKP